MNYVVKNNQLNWEAFRLYTFKKFEAGIYYRDVVLETDETIKFRLADVPLANGILRVDTNDSNKPIEIRLGHYALPRLGSEIKTVTKKVKGYEVTIIDNGKYQLAMIPLLGWEATEVISTNGLHPESESSKVINVVSNKSSNKIYATLILWKKSGDVFTNKELVPIRNINVNKDANTIIVNMTNGEQKQINY